MPQMVRYVEEEGPVAMVSEVVELASARCGGSAGRRGGSCSSGTVLQATCVRKTHELFEARKSVESYSQRQT